MPTSTIGHNPLLFGRNERSGIIAVESVGHFIRLFFRTAGRVHFHDEPFQPLSWSVILNSFRLPEFRVLAAIGR